MTMTDSWMTTLNAGIITAMTGSWATTLEMTGSWIITLDVETTIKGKMTGLPMGICTEMPDRSLISTNLDPWKKTMTDTDQTWEIGMADLGPGEHINFDPCN